jgi:AbrB family looped-hinge helix DNA binding protein
MTATTISPKYQVVIPKEVREQVHIRSGQRVTMVAKNGVIYIVPEVPLQKLKGTLKSLPTKGLRDKKDRI